MPGAFGHLIGAWICGKIFNKLTKTKLTRLMWAALLFGAISPDADFLIEWTIEDVHPHRTFSHSFFTVILTGVISYCVLNILSRFKKANIIKPAAVAIFFSFGILTHLILDLSTSESGVQIFWPFSSQWITFNNPLNHYEGTPTYDELKWFVKMSTIEMALGTAWIAYLFWKKKIEFD
jgi:membrane-bound metal-dependent hydrolase YbcI (DUF457 family)